MSLKLKPSKMICYSVAVSGVCLALSVSMLASIASPAYAWYNDNTSGNSLQIQTAQYGIHVTKVNAQGKPLPTEMVTISEGDLHYYILTATGTSTTGYCRIGVSTGEGQQTDYYYISPIDQGTRVNLVLQMASGTKVEFDAFWGKPGEDVPADHLVVPASTYVQEEGATLTAFIEISETYYIEYTVPERATLEAIAGHYGVTPEDILVFNGVDSIAPGDTIKIPNPATEEPYVPPEIYVVQEGDTLQSIADAHNVPLKALCQWNNLSTESTIYPGLELEIPVLYENIQAEPEPEESNAEESNAEESNAEESNAEESNAEGTNSEGTNSEESNSEGTNSEGTNSEGTNSEESNSEESNSEGTNSEESNSEGSNTEESNSAESNTEESNPAENNSEGSNTEESNSAESNTEESNSEESNSEGSNTEESNSEGTNSEESNSEESNSEESNSEESNSEVSNTEESNPAENNSEGTNSEETVSEGSESETIHFETSVEAEALETEEEEVLVCGVPRYFQNDYPDDRYAGGTVATSGCSVTSLTMVANAVTGYDYTVDELAEYFGGRAENNIKRLEIGSETLGLQFYKSENWHYTLDALKEGAIVIALMEETSLFTDSQHFIVLTGLTEDGERIYVNDPNGGNYNLWNLKNGFENGFKPEDILLGYGGAWVYQRTLEEIPERYSEVRLSKVFKAEKDGTTDPEVEALIAASNYPEIRLTMEERDLLAKVIWAEARGESAAGQQAIAEVVFNRMLSAQFGDDLKDVIYSEGQFRSVDKLEEAEPTQAQYQAIERAFFGTPVLNRNVLYFATYRTNDNVYMMIGNHIFCY